MKPSELIADFFSMQMTDTQARVINQEMDKLYGLSAIVSALEQVKNVAKPRGLGPSAAVTPAPVVTPAEKRRIMREAKKVAQQKLVDSILEMNAQGKMAAEIALFHGLKSSRELHRFMEKQGIELVKRRNLVISEDTKRGIIEAIQNLLVEKNLSNIENQDMLLEIAVDFGVSEPSAMGIWQKHMRSLKGTETPINRFSANGAN